MSQVTSADQPKPRPGQQHDYQDKPSLTREDEHKITFVAKLIRLPGINEDRGSHEGGADAKKLWFMNAVLDNIIANVGKRQDLANLKDQNQTTLIQMVPMHMLDESTRVLRTGVSKIKNKLDGRDFDPTEGSKHGEWNAFDYAVAVAFEIQSMEIATDSTPQKETVWALVVVSGSDAKKFGDDVLQDPRDVFGYLDDLNLLPPEGDLRLSNGTPADISPGKQVVILSNTHLKGIFNKNYPSKPF